MEKDKFYHIKKLMIFDMDGTILDSPTPDQGKLLYENITGVKYPHQGWWGRKESLLPEFDIKQLDVIKSHYVRATIQNNVGKVLLTNRMKKLQDYIMPILEKNQLRFHTYSFKYNNKSKLDRALDIISESYVGIEEVEFFDDMAEHVIDFTRYWDMQQFIAPELNFKLKLHLVSDKNWITLESKDDLKKLEYNLYLDDERTPALEHKNWVVVRNMQDFKSTILHRGLPAEMSLDHDLGEDQPTGYDCVKWMVYEMRYDLRHIEINVHSANTVGKDNILGLIKSWNKFI